jgi:catechol 2,3-dioxygenase-like lactoylglutathione lyase family enzyme
VSAIPAGISAITIFVSDVRRARAFYVSLFEREPVFEDEVASTFRLDGVLLNVLALSDAPELVEPAPVATASSAANALFTITVEDCDAACATLAAKGIEIQNGPIDRPWGVRTAAFLDPDGHAWELAQPIVAVSG